MQNANLKLMQIKNFKLPSLQEDNNSVQTQYQEQVQQNPVRQADPKLEKWLDQVNQVVVIKEALVFSGN
jgi:hypothetical protein